MGDSLASLLHSGKEAEVPSCGEPDDAHEPPYPRSRPHDSEPALALEVLQYGMKEGKQSPRSRGGIPLMRSSPTLLGKIILLIGAAVFKLRGKVHLETFTPDLILEDGESLEGYGLKASILHLPGHTKGSIAILTEDGSLFAGDTFFNMKHASQPIQDVDDYRASLEKTRPLLGRIMVVYPGHGKSFPGRRLSRITI